MVVTIMAVTIHLLLAVTIMDSVITLISPRISQKEDQESQNDVTSKGSPSSMLG